MPPEIPVIPINGQDASQFKPVVGIVVTAWNQEKVTADCLDSLRAIETPPIAIFLVDNGSDPPLQPILQSRYPHVQFLRNEENLGFAGGYNVGVRHALAQGVAYLFLLNNDTLVDPTCVAELVVAVTKDPYLGLVMPKIYYAADPQRIWAAGGNYRPILGEVQDNWRGQIDSAVIEQPCTIQFAPFCAVLLPSPVVQEVGLLDDQFFLYYEDLDYGQRLGRAGYRLLMVPTAKVWHKVSVSVGGWHSPVERFLMAQSSGRYFRRYGAGWRMFFVLPYRLGSALRLTAELVWRRQWRPLCAYWLGLYYGWLGQHARTPPPTWITQI